MPTAIFKHTGKKAHETFDAIVFFFQFLGELVSRILRHANRIVWGPTIQANLQASAIIVIPLVLLSLLIGMALTLSVHLALSRFNLQHQATFILETTMLRDMAPLMIGFVLCVHSGLNLIDKNHPSLHKPPILVLLETIIPLFVGINLCALLLYTYVFTSFILGAFFTSYFILQANTDEYLLRLTEIIEPIDWLASVVKTLVYATIASFIAGYYYYGVANDVISTRQAVSRVITRSLFWLILISGVFKLIIP